MGLLNNFYQITVELKENFSVTDQYEKQKVALKLFKSIINIKIILDIKNYIFTNLELSKFPDSNDFEEHVRKCYNLI